MFKGELIHKNSDPVYTRTFVKEGENALLVVDLMEIVGSFSVLTITVEYRNRDEISWSGAGNFDLSDPLLTGVYAKKVSPTKDLMRLKFVQGGGDWMRVLVWPPSWR